MFQKMKASLLARDIRRRGGTPREGYVPYDGITRDLLELGIRVVPYAVPVKRLNSYIDESRYSELPYYDGGKTNGAREKYLEHFVSIELLKPKPGAVLIDVASMDSPFWEIMADRAGLVTYRQDLMYPPGVHGRRIGGSAADLPLPNEFADLLTLHCSFEHFEGDTDIRFIEEASRILKPGGRVCILPLYTSSEYAIQTHVRGWRRFRAPFAEGDVVFVGPHWGPPHARFYDARAFLHRIVKHAADFDLTIYEITNTRDCGPECYLRYAAVLEKKA